MIKTCIVCEKEFDTVKLNMDRRRKTCSDKCKKYRSPESKKKVSIGIKKYLKENPKKHVWKRDEKFKSEPCELVKSYLLEKNINFIEELSPLEGRSFSMDIAFPDKKIAIEINGNQHYNNDGSLKDYYQERHDLIEKEGWKLIELHYSIAFNLDKLDKILDMEKGIDYTPYIKKLKEDKIKKEIAKIEDINRKKQLKIDKLNKEKEQKIEALLNSNINFNKYGWVGEASILIGCKPQKVSQWMNKNMNNFYNEKCFRRKN